MKFSILFLILFLSACMTTTKIIKDDGGVIIIKSSSDALVEYKEGGKEYKVDNRGKAGILEDVMKMWSLKYLNEEE